MTTAALHPKRLVVLVDGMADEGRDTPLCLAHTPCMDLLARLGRTGLLRTIPPGYPPGSEAGILSILGYDLSRCFPGRGALEAVGLGVDLRPSDVAFRCNLVHVDASGRLADYAAGGITTGEAAQLASALQQSLGGGRVRFLAGTEHRLLLLLADGMPGVRCVSPLDALRRPLLSSLPAGHSPDAALLRSLVLRSREVLEGHEVNRLRRLRGLPTANAIWPYGPGHCPVLPPLSALHPALRTGAVVAAPGLVRGIGRCAGLRVPDVPGATGGYDTDYAAKAGVALRALQVEDFVLLHVEAADTAGHEGDRERKRLVLEDVDRLVVRPLYDELARWPQPVTLVVLPDHATPCSLRVHTAAPVPYLVWRRGIGPDGATAFNEEAVARCHPRADEAAVAAPGRTVGAVQGISVLEL